MSKSSNIFELREQVVANYAHFARSFTNIRARDIREKVDQLFDDEKYWPQPLIQINPKYKTASCGIEQLIRDGNLEPEMAHYFARNGKPLSLYEHQSQAITMANQKRSYIVTTGTGSGKSLCFIMPIVNHILREKKKDSTPRTRALIIYPMNALANSQIKEFQQYLGDNSDINFQRYTGQEDHDTRKRIAETPPDIILTNYMMLELMLTRHNEYDPEIIEHCRGLEFLVLDELHTYRGRQGADIAMLIRRLRERMACTDLVCIGTSATMSSDGTIEDQKTVVAEVAAKLFALRNDQMNRSNVIGETLDRKTAPSRYAEQPDLISALPEAIARWQEALACSNAELVNDPLAIWVETTLGIHRPDKKIWVRAEPQKLDDAAKELHKHTHCDIELCKTALMNLLIQASLPENDRCKSGNDEVFFAFKLHQFFAGIGSGFSTLESPERRGFTTNEQVFVKNKAGQEVRLYPIYFCRECGHEYHPVTLAKNDNGDFVFLGRHLDDSETETPEGYEYISHGYLSPIPTDDEEFDFDGTNTDSYPDVLCKIERGQRKLKNKNYEVNAWFVQPDGIASSKPTVETSKFWFVQDKFNFCIRCKDCPEPRARERNKLASLSVDGRSTATTIIVESTLNYLQKHDVGDPYSRKLLGFTDNRQDAALQAGHFNDFIFVTILRSSWLYALKQAATEGIGALDAGDALMHALGFDKTLGGWHANTQLFTGAQKKARETLKHILGYRLWCDQRKGWRYIHPNLEQLGLVQVEYIDLDELIVEDSYFQNTFLEKASPEVKKILLEDLLDWCRLNLAFTADELNTELLYKLEKSSEEFLSPWKLSKEDESLYTSKLAVVAAKLSKNGEDRNVVNLNSRGGFGRFFKYENSMRRRPDDSIRTEYQKMLRYISSLSSNDFCIAIHSLFQLLYNAGIVTRQPNQTYGECYQINIDHIRFRASEYIQENTNAFFYDLYQSIIRMLENNNRSLLSLSAHEHTAQVDGKHREILECKFRYQKEDREKLDTMQEDLKNVGEVKEFLPILFCSPTMELGIDISALNTVYMRNVPPTPANYAQRSGRGGRSGQAALVMTYCSFQSPHDQYYFDKPADIVQGQVKAPLIELANKDLIQSHLYAIWLACTKTELSPAIIDLIDSNNKTFPLKQEILDAMSSPGIRVEAQKHILTVLNDLDSMGYLTKDSAPWYEGAEKLCHDILDNDNPDGAKKRFIQAFDRWRTLLLSAMQQMDISSQIMQSINQYSKDECDEARRQFAQALSQKELLTSHRPACDQSSACNDFETYRYLATEGFLPGYNFPRLPLMAHIPGGRDNHYYIQRPRFLALAEFGPLSLIYHSGRTYRVYKAILGVDPQNEPGAIHTGLTTQKATICPKCGACQWNDAVSNCKVCNEPLDHSERIANVYRIENVDTYRQERITANDEERQRKGFDIQTTFEWAVRTGGKLDVRRAMISYDHDSSTECLAELHYCAGAQITRINKGFRRSSQAGFAIDTKTGRWGEDKEDDRTDKNKISNSVRICPMVQDHKNALLFKLTVPNLSKSFMATLQHALLRGIQCVYQIEQSELLAEPLPSKDNRNSILFYEAAEGGAGVLSRLVSEPQAFAIVAQEALRCMHYEVCDPLPDSAESLVNNDEECIAGCYKCLLSYYNQTEHQFINRRDDVVKDMLLKMAKSSVIGEHKIETSTCGFPAPDPITVEGVTFPLSWKSKRLIAMTETCSDELLEEIDDMGIQVIWPRSPETIETVKSILNNEGINSAIAKFDLEI